MPLTCETEQQGQPNVSVCTTFPTVRAEAYAVGDLLPARAACPFALVAETVLAHVDDALAPLDCHIGQGLGSVSQPVQGAGPVAIYDDVDVLQEPFKHSPALGRLQIEIGCPLAYVAVHLEERNVAEVWAGDLEHIGPVLSQDARDYGPGDDAAHLNHLDSGEEPAAFTAPWQGPRGGAVFELLHGPWRQFPVDFTLKRATISSQRARARQYGASNIRGGFARTLHA